jgi:formate dehydrogenase
MSKGSAPSVAVEHATFCKQCEALCGVLAYVEDGRVTKMAADPANEFSRGYVCPKGVNDHHVTNDPDRVVRPLQRQSDGTFVPVAWEEALADISARLRHIVEAHGPQAVAGYLGNPSVWDYKLFLAMVNFIKGLKSPNLYATASIDINNRWVVNQLLYGNPLRSPIPDLPRTDFHFMVGANPLVSHGSMLTQPRIRDALIAITRRGGRVVAVDPRQTETARQFEWVPIRANTDAWMLLSILQVIFAEGLEDRSALAQQAAGIEALRRVVDEYPPEVTEDITGIAADTLRNLARDMAGASSLSVHGRCGASLGSFSTVVTYLLDVLAIVTGNLDRAGGSVFPRPAIDLERMIKLFGFATYGSYQSRVSGFNELMGTLPVGELPREITTPGAGQVRALFVGAGNIVTTAPGAGRMADALGQLELFVSFDFYQTETNSSAHYILPDLTALEREDFPFFPLLHLTVPYMQWTDAVVEPRGEARPAWWVIDQICRRTKIAPNPLAPGRLAWRLGIRPGLPTVLDLFLRTGPYGDLFGLRRRGPRLSRKKLLANPRGVLLEPFVPTGNLARLLPHQDGKVHLDPAPILADLERLRSFPTRPPADFPLRLVSLRELRSQNSRLHNVERLMRNREQTLRMHPDDAEAAGVEDGVMVAVVSPRGRIEVPVKLTKEMMPGNIALPQGWGHRGGWKRAVAAGGANYNCLTPDGPDDLDRVSGQAWLNGFPVRVEPIAPHDNR